MILTQCAACAKPLAHDAPRCIRCWTRYCDALCQLEHWNNGHKKKCKKIARGGGAEQFYADAKYKEALEAAVVESAPRIPADAICYICRENASRECLVTGCGCHGGDGIAHVSCLMRMAQLAEKENEGLVKWQTCVGCGQSFHSQLATALGWGCWKTYLGRPETDWIRCQSLGFIVDGLRLHDAEAALSIIESQAALLRRFWPNDKMGGLNNQTNAANCYERLGRKDETLRLRRAIYAALKASKPGQVATIQAGNNLSLALAGNGLFTEAKDFSRELLDVARESLEEMHVERLMAAIRLAESSALDPDAPRTELIEAEARFSDLIKKARIILGPEHPRTVGMIAMHQSVSRKLEPVRHEPEPPVPDITSHLDDVLYQSLKASMQETIAADVDAMSIEKLKSTINWAGLSMDDCIEKEDLRARARLAQSRFAELVANATDAAGLLGTTPERARRAQSELPGMYARMLESRGIPSEDAGA